MKTHRLQVWTLATRIHDADADVVWEIEQAMNLNDLSYFAQVIDHGGFAPAARALGVPKSTLSKRVAALEEALGVRLIQRTSRTFVATEVGREVYRHASAVRSEADAALSIAHGRLAKPSGTVRITASVPTAQLRLALLLPALASKWPALRIELHATDRFVDLVQEGFDLGVRDHFAPLPDSGLVQRRVCDDPIVLVASRTYLRRRGTPKRPEDLAEHDGIASALAPATWTLEHAGERGERAGATTYVATPRTRFTSDEATVIASAVAHGLGIAALPRSLCRQFPRVLPAWTAGSVTTTLLVPHRRGALPSVRVVADYLATHIAAAAR